MKQEVQFISIENGDNWIKMFDGETYSDIDRQLEAYSDTLESMGYDLDEVTVKSIGNMFYYPFLA